MQIQVQELPGWGIPVCQLAYGTVVMRPGNNVDYYIIISPMDGSGRKVLVTLGGGTLKEVDQQLRVVPVNCVLVVDGNL